MDILDMCIEFKNDYFTQKVLQLMTSSMDEIFISEIQELKTEKDFNRLFNEIVNCENINDMEKVMDSYMKQYTSQRSCERVSEKSKDG